MHTRLCIFLLTLIGIVVAASGLVTAAEGDGKGQKQETPMVADGKTVKVHYTLTVDGKKIDSSVGGAPMEFQAGSGMIIPGFEKNLKGMAVGQKKSFQVSPDDAYGQVDPKSIVEVPKEKLPADAKIEPGATLFAQGPDGSARPVKITEVKKDSVLVDLNHPLAGKTLNFDVEIVEVQ